MSKYCPTCNTDKDESLFGSNKYQKCKLNTECRECAKERSKQYRKSNPDKFKDSKLKSTYGISLKDYNRMLEEQKGVCAICYKPQVDKALAVDHCHKSGKVRGLLCSLCNTSLGKMGDSPDRLRRAAAYLEEFIND